VKKFHRLFAAAAVGVIATTGVACKSATPYAAKVNGIVLSKDGLEDELEAMRGNKKYLEQLEANGNQVLGSNEATFNSAFVATVLNRRVYFELIRQEFQRRKLKVTNDDQDFARQQVLLDIGGEEVFKDFPKAYSDEILRTTAQVWRLQQSLASTSDANLRAYYEDHKDQFESVCAAHILVETKAQADAVVKQLGTAKDKKATFADLASKRSKDPGSGANGGDLGCASPAGYVGEFKDAVRTQKIGVIGQPVKTQFGYHVIRVDSREAAKPYAEVKEEVKSAITDQQQGAFSQFILEAATEADVEVNPRYGSFDKTGQSPTVVPPKGPAATTADADADAEPPGN
jgi:foldase protein PrsA